MLMEVGVPGDKNAMQVLGVIPARYKSSRFPGKPLVKICGIPMLKRTYMQAKKAIGLEAIVIATEDERIFNYCLSEGMPVAMTTDNCLTGTDRLAEIAQMDEYRNHELFVNIQGDEPIIDPKAITQVINLYKKYNNQYIAYNLYRNLTDEKQLVRDTIIKVIVNQNDELMYMSRFPVPYSNSGNKAEHKQQVPVYGYTQQALELFSKHEKTINEKYEDIELLRFVDLGEKIKMMETDAVAISVDVPEDIQKVENVLNKK